MVVNFKAGKGWISEFEDHILAHKTPILARILQQNAKDT